ncbi:MAG: hypothetical protein Q7S14_00410 [bacterium]|nr:hypothetical protein [bacterium]
MLPLSHTYIAINVTKRKNNLLILGSILPDIATTSSEQIGRDKIHNAPKEFWNFVNKNYLKLSDLALGVRLHSQIDGGADFYSDDQEVGYAKIEGNKISADVARLLGIENGSVSLMLAHNFIEMAVDLHLYENQKEIWEIYKDALEGVKTEFEIIAKCMGNYLELDQSLVFEELNNLVTFLSPYNLMSKDIIVNKVALPLIKLRFQKEVSAEDTIKIADKALAITRPTYKEFLDNAVINVKKNILC